jgi:hypothetical protein
MSPHAPAEREENPHLSFGANPMDGGTASAALGSSVPKVFLGT